MANNEFNKVNRFHIGKPCKYRPARLTHNEEVS
jgi:hypothetical protein